MQPRVYALIVLLVLTASAAYGDGCYFPKRDAAQTSNWQAAREAELITEPAQKAAIFYDQGREQLIISPSFSGSVRDFAWVVPVPSRPHVEVLSGALFHELARIVEPAPPVSMAGSMVMGAHAMPSAPPPVTVLERKTVGDFDVSVLSATDSNALQKWLLKNGYALPQSARAPLAWYIKRHWTFVACRISDASAAEGLQEGDLDPLRLSFASSKIVYPMRLSSVNPDSFNLVLYVLVRMVPGGPGGPALQKWPGARPDIRQMFQSLGSSDDEFPTLARFYNGPVTWSISWLDATISPRECKNDFIWVNR